MYDQAGLYLEQVVIARIPSIGEARTVELVDSANEVPCISCMTLCTTFTELGDASSARNAGFALEDLQCALFTKSEKLRKIAGPVTPNNAALTKGCSLMTDTAHQSLSTAKRVCCGVQSLASPIACRDCRLVSPACASEPSEFVGLLCTAHQGAPASQQDLQRAGSRLLRS